MVLCAVLRGCAPQTYWGSAQAERAHAHNWLCEHMSEAYRNSADKDRDLLCAGYGPDGYKADSYKHDDAGPGAPQDGKADR